MTAKRNRANLLVDGDGQVKSDVAGSPANCARRRDRRGQIGFSEKAISPGPVSRTAPLVSSFSIAPP